MFVALYQVILEFGAARLIEIMSDHCNLKSVTKFLIQHLASLGISTVCLYPVRRATESRGFTKLKSKFSIDDVETKKAFSLLRSCICETYVQSFQFKILNNILFTNSRLAKVGIIQSDLCTFCNTGAETIDHLFFYCVYSRAFWEEFQSYWFAILSQGTKETRIKNYFSWCDRY